MKTNTPREIGSGALRGKMSVRTADVMVITTTKTPNMKAGYLNTIITDLRASQLYLPR